MANLDELNPLFSCAYSIRFRPSHSSLHLDIPTLDSTSFSQANTILKTAAKGVLLSLSLSFKNEKQISLTILSETESITIEKLHPMYGIREKLQKSNPETVELCLFNYQHLGIYIGTKFELIMEE